MSPLCESYLRAEQLDARSRSTRCTCASAPSACSSSCPRTCRARTSSPTTPYFSSYSDSWVAHARRYADDDDRRGSGSAPDSLVDRGGEQRRLPAAALRRRGHPGARRRAGGEHRRGRPGQGHPDRGRSSSARRPARRSPPRTAGPTWWSATTSSPTCPTSSTSPPGCARWSSRPAWSRSSSRTCCGSSSAASTTRSTTSTTSTCRCSPRRGRWRPPACAWSTSRSWRTHGGSLRVHARPARRGRRAVATRRRRCSTPRPRPGCTRVDGPRRLRRGGASRSSATCSTFLLDAPRRGQARGRLRRTGQGQHAAQPLRDPVGPAGVHRRPQPAQAGHVPARHAHPDPRARAHRRGPSRTTCWSCRGTCAPRSSEQLVLRPRLGRPARLPDPRRSRWCDAMKVVLFCGGLGHADARGRRATRPSRWR